MVERNRIEHELQTKIKEMTEVCTHQKESLKGQRFRNRKKKEAFDLWLGKKGNTSEQITVFNHIDRVDRSLTTKSFIRIL